MAIASARRIGLGGGLTLALALASSAQSIQIQAEPASGLTLAARNGVPGVCLMETGITYGEWIPGADGYAGELHGELFDAQTALAYRLRADLHWLAVPGPGILPTQGSISGEILSADRGDVIAYLVGDWEQTGTFGRFSALMIDARFPYQVPPAFIGGIEGDFSQVLESSAQDTSHAEAQASGQVQSEQLPGTGSGPGNLEHDMIPEGYHQVSGSAAPGGAHQSARGSQEEPTPAPGNLENDLLFEDYHQVSGSAAPGAAHKLQGDSAPVQGPPMGSSVGNLENDLIPEGYHQISGAGSAAPGGQEHAPAQLSGAQSTSGGGAPGPVIEPVLEGVYFGSWTLCQS